MGNYIKYIFFLFLFVFFISCNKESVSLSQEDIQIINRVSQLSVLEEDDREKALSILDAAIKEKPYIWDFYSSKLFIYLVNVDKVYTRDEYVRNSLLCYEEYISNSRIALTTYQNYNYGFILTLDGQIEKGKKYLEDAFRSLTKLKKPPVSGSKEYKAMEDAIMSGFLLGKIDDRNIENYQYLFENNKDNYLVIKTMFSKITPEIFYEKLGKISIDYED